MEYIDFSGHPESGDDPPIPPITSFDAPDRSKKGSSKVNRDSCDIKPRLTREQHDILEGHYEQQSKPSTQVKKGFAASLNVTPEKINNWFQNRRAKSKQEAKKSAEPSNLYQSPEADQSDSEPSPNYAAVPQEYSEMMQQWSSGQHVPNGLGISHSQELRNIEHHIDDHYLSSYIPDDKQYSQLLMPPPTQPNIFESPQAVNRRTLTQEQFDVFANAGGLFNDDGGIGSANSGFGDMWAGFVQGQSVGSNGQQNLSDHAPQHDAFAYSNYAGWPHADLNPATAHSMFPGQAIPVYPSASQMQMNAAISTTSSEWSGSRSSSIYDSGVPAPTRPQPQQYQNVQAASTWQPGQSVPVNVNTLKEEFQQAAQASQARPTNNYTMMHEQPLAWPEDDALTRRDSSTSLLAMSMSNVGIQSTNVPSSATFKSPTPGASLASRRHRARPAALGLTSLRSQSCNVSRGPKSPGQVLPQQQQPGMSAGQPLRRIRSSAVLGFVPQGRVVKSTSGSAQRSPMTMNFADGISSPRSSRHPSLQTHGSHAPPTPMSPREFQPSEPGRQMTPWQGVNVNVQRQFDLGDADLSRVQQYRATASTMTSRDSSPPHTPLFYQQHQYIPQRFTNSVSVENTPPQSAPATQSCFSIDALSYPQQVGQPGQALPQPSNAPHMQHFTPVQTVPQQHMPNHIFDQRLAFDNNGLFPNQHASVQSNQSSAEASFQVSNDSSFANTEDTGSGFPQTNTLARPYQQPYAALPYMTNLPYVEMPNSATAATSPYVRGGAQLPKSHSEFFIHEYNPPPSVRKGALPRQPPLETSPKNYTFSNTGPEYFKEKESSSRATERKESSSPASSTGFGITMATR